MEYIKNNIISGIIILIPIVAIIYALQSVQKHMEKFSKLLSDYIPIDSVLGFAVSSILGWLLVAVALFLIGLVSQINFFKALTANLEENILNLIPGYESNVSKLKGKLDEKVKPDTEESPSESDKEESTDDRRGKMFPAIIKSGDTYRIVIVTKIINEEKCVVFLPSAPDAASGNLIVISRSKIKPVSIPAEDIVEFFHNYGEFSKTDSYNCFR